MTALTVISPRNLRVGDRFRRCRIGSQQARQHGAVVTVSSVEIAGATVTVRGVVEGRSGVIAVRLVYREDLVACWVSVER